MKILNRLKISTRVYFLALIPLVIIVALLIERLNNAQVQLQKIERLDKVMEYTDVTYGYISELLEESRFNNLYLQAKESEASQRRGLMLMARNRSIEAQGQYEDFVRRNDAELKEFSVLYEQIQQTLDFFPRLDLIRSAADKKLEQDRSINPEVHTMYELTTYIRRVASSLSEVSVLALQSEQLGKMAHAYFYIVSDNMHMLLHASMIPQITVMPRSSYLYGLLFIRASASGDAQAQFNIFATEEIRAELTELTQHPDYLTFQDVAHKARQPPASDNPLFQIDPSINWQRITDSLSSEYQRIVNMSVDELVSTKNTLLAQAKNKVIQSFLILGTVLILILGISYLIARSVTKPLKDIVASLSFIATSKDMSNKMTEEGKDELAELKIAFNSLLMSLNQALHSVQTEANIIGAKTTQVSSLMDESKGLSNNQLAATDSISVAVTQMTTTISEIAKMATSTSDAVQRAFDISIESAKGAETSRHMMENLTVELGNTQEVANKLQEECNLIGNVLSVIQGIAEQTNLLALNAAIEAARAGEMGRGFAVVADEVRSLAGRTQESTEQIQKQIETLQKGAAAATNNMKKLQEEGEKAVEIVISGAGAFDVMKDQLDSITHMSHQIATAAEEQTSVSNEINQRIVGIRDDSEDISQKTNTTSEASKELKETGERLNEAISEFTLHT